MASSEDEVWELSLIESANEDFPGHDWKIMDKVALSAIDSGGQMYQFLPYDIAKCMIRAGELDMGLRVLDCIQFDDGCGLLFESIESAEKRCDFGQYVECQDGTDIFTALQDGSYSKRCYGYDKGYHFSKLAINKWPGWKKPCVRTYVKINENATFHFPLDTFETQLRNHADLRVDVTWKFCILGRHDDYVETDFKVNKAFYNKLKIESIKRKDGTKLWVLKVKDKYKETLKQRRFEDGKNDFEDDYDDVPENGDELDAFLIGYLRKIEDETNALHDFKNAYKTTELSLNQIRSDPRSSQLPSVPPEIATQILHFLNPKTGEKLGVKVAFADLCLAP